MTDAAESTPERAGDASGAPLLCSARGCRKAADTDVRWNNPRLHPPERRKHWLACAEHRDSLSGYLSARGLLREVVPLDRDALPG